MSKSPRDRQVELEALVRDIFTEAYAAGDTQGEYAARGSLGAICIMVERAIGRGEVGKLVRELRSQPTPR
jgi:hypothetical protein